MESRKLTVNEVVTRFIEVACERYRYEPADMVDLIKAAERHRGPVNAYSLFECMTPEVVAEIVDERVARTEDPLVAALDFVETMNAIYQREPRQQQMTLQ